MSIRMFSIALSLLLASQVQAMESRTQLEESGWKTLTSYQQMMDYLQPLVASSTKVSMVPMGTSVSGRVIPALYFSNDPVFASQRANKPLVMISCQQHGDEPSGKEAALIVARKLLNENSDLLDNLDLILVPQVNPDGSELGTRRNANAMDLNRNHVILSEPESLALHQLFLKWLPEVTLDVHEYNAIKDPWIEAGFTKDADEMLGGVTNLNIDPNIIRFSRESFIPDMGKGVAADGFRFHRYIVGDPFEAGVVRFSTTAINDSRQSMGMYNSLSFIIEGKRYANTTNELEKRTRGQVSAMLNFLQTSNQHAADMLAIVKQARATMEDMDQSHIQMEYYADANHPVLNFPVFDLKSWERTNRDLENFKPLVKIRKSVYKPAAYAFPATEMRLIELLKRHQIPFQTLQRDDDFKTETYRVQHIVEAIDEEKPTYLVDVHKIARQETLQSGMIIVPVSGSAANLIPLMLEPESTWGIVSPRATGKYRFADYLVEGQDYPVKRLPPQDKLNLEKLAE